MARAAIQARFTLRPGPAWRKLAGLGAAIPILASASCGFFPISRFSRTGTTVLEQAPKPAPVDSEFHGCGDAGSQPDYPLNRLKNRVDDAARYLAVPWSMIAALPWPREVGYRFRNQWTRSETERVARYEGVAIQIEGYVQGYRHEIPEPPNCYDRDGADRDFHIWFSEKPHGSEHRSIVVEITPRVRASHPGWDEDHLAALQHSQVRVRLRGWLMLDQMHPENVGVNRITLWEVHPIMHVDWRRADGRWVSLDDSLPATAPRESESP